MSVIENLLALHSVDKQVRGLRSGVDSAAARLGAHQKQLDNLQSELTELQQKHRLAQATAANLETEGSSVDERVEKLRVDLTSSATTKQYNAILEEINNLKGSRGALDERALAELERADGIGVEAQAVQEQIDERTTLADAAKIELEERQAAVKERLEELEKERAIKAEVVPSAALEIFDQAADDFEGDAMSPIEELDRKRLEYACSTCNSSMPFSIVNTIMLESDRVHQCEGCLRILYMPAELRAGLVVSK